MSNTDNKTYTGWKKWKPTNEEWATFSVEPYAPFELKENEYLLVYYDDENGTERLSAQYCMEGGKLRKFGRNSIKFRGKDKDNVITPRNDEQICAFQLIKNRNVPVKVFTGPFGCGKDLLMTAESLELIKANQFEKIIWIRNNIDVKDTKDLGALPGDTWNKLVPFLGPYIDSAGVLNVKQMVEREQLVIEPLQSLRGRNFTNSIIICSEAQNMTLDHLKLILGRAAEGTEVWLNGDWKQTDKAVFERSNGLQRLIKYLAGDKLFGYVHMLKTERSAVARLADKIELAEAADNN